MQQIYPWQQAQWQQLITLTEKRCLPHAILLLGQVGLGKSSFAIAMSQLLLCKEGSACGECRSCKLLVAKTHPDLFTIFPEQAGKQIKVDQIRDIITKVTQKPQVATCQVVIINPAAAMNLAASNALLKTLEEPPGQLFFILVTANCSELLPTVVSRCQRVNFQPPSADVALEWLKEQGAAKEEARFALQLSQNSPLAAKQMITAGSLAQYKSLLQDMEGLVSRKTDPVVFAAKWKDMELVDVCNHWQIFLMGLVTNRNNATVGARRAVPVKIFKCLDKILDLKRILVNNPNKQLALEDLAIFIQQELINVN